jgi:hypothetical protein
LKESRKRSLAVYWHFAPHFQSLHEFLVVKCTLKTDSHSTYRMWFEGGAVVGRESLDLHF